MKNPESVTASEIGDFVYCGEAWRLAQVGTKPTAVIQAALTEGTRHHVGLTVVETVAIKSIKRGRILIVLGVIVLALAVLWLVSR